jgi:hypothetical protein
MEPWWPALHPSLPFILADPNLALELSGYRPIEVLREGLRAHVALAVGTTRPCWRRLIRR